MRATRTPIALDQTDRRHHLSQDNLYSGLPTTRSSSREPFTLRAEVQRVFAECGKHPISKGKSEYLKQLFKKDVDARQEILAQLESYLKSITATNITHDFYAKEAFDSACALLIFAAKERSPLAPGILASALALHPSPAIISSAIKLGDVALAIDLFSSISSQPRRMDYDEGQAAYESLKLLNAWIAERFDEAVKQKDVPTITIIALSNFWLSGEALEKLCALASNGERQQSADAISEALGSFFEAGRKVPDEIKKRLAEVLFKSVRETERRSRCLGSNVYGACELLLTLESLGLVTTALAIKFDEHYGRVLEHISGNGNPLEEKELVSAAQKILTREIGDKDLWCCNAAGMPIL